MKKAVALLTGFMFILSLTACGEGSSDSSSKAAKENSVRKTTSESNDNSIVPEAKNNDQKTKFENSDDSATETTT